MARLINKKHYKHAITVFLMLLTGGCGGDFSTKPASDGVSEVAKSAPTALEMKFEKGQLLSLISLAPKSGEAAKAARQNYLQQAFALAGEFGLKPAGSLPVSAVGVGRYSPAAISFFSWPDAQAEQSFRVQPGWPAIKATRPDGWDELRIHDVVLEHDVTLRFDPDKTYTMATAWLNLDRPDDYDRYLNNIEEAVNEAGGRFFYQMREPRFSSLATSRGAPGRITFVEWNSPSGLARFQETRGFKSNVRLLQSGTTGFEIIVVRNVL